MKRLNFNVILASACLLFSSVQLAYAGSTLVTDAVGTQELWTFEENLGVQNLTSRINQVDGKGITQTWDANNNLLSRTDAEGRVTTYTYNATNQRISMTEASGTKQQRTTTYAYVSPDIDRVTRTTRPSVHSGSFKETVNVYDASLNILSTTVNGFTLNGTPVSRTTSFTYNSRGQVTQIDGPRTDVDDITTFVYYDCTTGAECGQLKRVTNALGHTTSYEAYDGNARLIQSTDANAITTMNTYHPRGWLLTRTQYAIHNYTRITSYEYDNVGQLTQTTAPDGTVLSYEYDAAQDLRAITDSLGNRIEYQYDAKGNRNLQRTVDPDGTLVAEVQTIYDARNFIESINTAGSVTQLVNDAVGNVSQQKDPNQNPSTHNDYDALDRLNNTLDALSNNTSYQYNVADQLIHVSAPNGAVTQYEYDDLGNLLKETSPDRGIVHYEQDTAGNVITQTDARGITVNYQYDTLNRLTKVMYPDPSENVRYLYDEDCLFFGEGRLCAIVDASGTEEFIYDPWGNVLLQGHNPGATIPAANEEIRYHYDTGDRLSAMIYPSGRRIEYTRDAIGRVIGVNSLSTEGTTTELVTGRDYRADGVWTTQQYGNGLSQSKQYDIQGRLINHSANDYTRQYSYDANGNMLGSDDDNQGSLDSLYDYDPLDRLITNTVSDLGIAMSFDYDANGNRTQTIDQDTTTTLTYESNSNRSETIGSNPMTLDLSGRVVVDEQGRTYEYNQAGRLATLRQKGQVVGEYEYNAKQLRRLKRVNGVETVFYYDLTGNLIAESDETGTVTKEYVYVDGERIAMFVQASYQTDRNKKQTKKQKAGVQAEQVHYYVNDHLGTPQRLVNSNEVVSWQANYEAFGKAIITTEDVTQNHRFPGQYFDEESNLHYNWNRYYEPKTGRYITSDPIGLEGGLNTFGYVEGNPINSIDPEGLAEICCRLVANPVVGKIIGQRHCYIKTDDGKTYGLYPEKGNGNPEEDDRRDDGGICFDCPAKGCDQNFCFKNTSANYPRVIYKSLGPNSNTYAGNLAKSCCEGGIPSGVSDAPGIKDPIPVSSPGNVNYGP